MGFLKKNYFGKAADVNTFHKIVPQGLRKSRIWPMVTVVEKVLRKTAFLVEGALFGILCILVGAVYISFCIVWELADYLIRKIER